MEKALFLFFDKDSEVTTVFTDSANYPCKYLIFVDREAQDVSGYCVATVPNIVDGLIEMKRIMDGKSILEAMCFVPCQNQSTFISIKDVIFPPVCNISLEFYPGDDQINPLDSIPSHLDISAIIMNRLQKIESCNTVQTIQSKMIPTDLFIHGYSKRYGGISNYPGMKSLNLVYSRRKPDSIFVVKENARRLCRHLGVDHEKYLLAKANHGNKIWVFENSAPDSYDGIVTRTPGVTVASPASDCNMLLLADPVRRVCGAVHAGWKGILAGVVQSGVKAMVSSCGSNPKNIVASLGPSLSVCCCEFGKEDSKKFESIADDVVVWYEGKEKPHIDLRLATVTILEKCGLKRINIDDGANGSNSTKELSTCTKCDPNKDFFSYRRDGPKFGNQVAFICIRN